MLLLLNTGRSLRDYAIYENKVSSSNNLHISNAADGEAIRLGAVAHVADPTVEVYVPATGGIVLRTTPESAE